MTGLEAPYGGGTVYDEIRAERERAHAKHGATSMESTDPLDLNRLAILMEEVGEVAKEFNDARHRADCTPRLAGEEYTRTELRKELIQVAAMATAWADVLGSFA